MDAIVLERLSNATKEAVCVNDRWLPRSQAKFYCDRSGATYKIYLAIPRWLLRNKFSRAEFRLMSGVMDIDLTGLEPFEPWTLDLKQDALNALQYGRVGIFGQ